MKNRCVSLMLYVSSFSRREVGRKHDNHKMCTYLVKYGPDIKETMCRKQNQQRTAY